MGAGSSSRRGYGSATSNYAEKMMKQPEDPIKILVIGVGGVGKTSLVRRIVRQWFIEDPLDAQYEDERASMETMVDPSANHVATIKVNDKAQKVTLDDLMVGSHDFSVRPKGLGDTDAILAMYSVVDHQSFLELSGLLNELFKLDSPIKGVPIYFLANKSDLLGHPEGAGSTSAAVSTEEAESLSQRWNLKKNYCATISVRQDENVTSSLQELVRIVQVKRSDAIVSQRMNDRANQRKGTGKYQVDD